MLPTRQHPDLKEKPISPQRYWLQSGNLRCLYENGFVRYLSAGNRELIRSLYPAVRDQFWQTATATISEEMVKQLADGFQISYRADYAVNDIRYIARVSITSSDGRKLSISFSGTAVSNFLRNRIGLCALLPTENLRGKPCLVGHPGGDVETILFPQYIHPVQPFTDIRTLEWETSGRIRVRLECSGDVFETEDQRNWGDASYKIYSTPHHLPLPAVVRKGDSVQQELSIGFDYPEKAGTSAPDAYTPVIFHPGNHSFPFPGIGFCSNHEAQTPDEETIKMLRRLVVDHYRIELFLSENWIPVWTEANRTARRLETKIHVAIYPGTAPYSEQLDVFLAEAAKEPGLVSCVLIFPSGSPLSLTPAENGMPDLIAEIRKSLPGVLVGSGSDSFFAHWNQQASIPEDPGGFISIPVNPQVHLPDSLTMVENLPAMSDIIETVRYHSASPPVYMGPLTLKMRYNPDVARADPGSSPGRFPYASDSRQQSMFAAAWTAVAMRYLCQADKVSVFEITGDRGLMPAHSPEQGLAVVRVFPVYLLLRELTAFKPKRILLSRSLRPMEVDGLVVENIHGDRLMIFCNFSRERQTLQLRTDSWKTLPLFAKIITPSIVHDLQEDGEKFRSSPYETFHLSEGNNFRLPAGAILFLTTLQDWSFS